MACAGRGHWPALCASPLLKLSPSGPSLPFSSETGMITLYHAPRSRSSRFIFLLEELGTPYKIHPVTIRRGDGSGVADPANPHPHGKVPVIRDGDTIVF